ncbi:MAG: hypothetical protein PWP16_675 [Eubacteriaceae bacterium]|nr:hypothetical protein [Eubacteriaceae bacterium]MDK2904446.1 hypothetical protein [Eubacteriaceae bacterium]MDK2936787.1 hypothetical protein [Eubacteriaceae bacterium]MDK2961226.1 hypothetical protein [Eubacteriaceae bacterium]MDN5307312.1 hypothetical protein [Eubacteriaceae bacterium]
MNSRIKEIRKKLGYSQEMFGSLLGVTKAAISRIETGERGTTDQMIRAIVREFNVSEDWLRNGGDPDKMFNPTPDDQMAELRSQFNLDELDMKIVNEYMKLSPENRTVFKSYFVKVFGGDLATEDEELELEVDTYRLELEAQRDFTTSEASQTISEKEDEVG